MSKKIILKKRVGGIVYIYNFNFIIEIFILICFKKMRVNFMIINFFFNVNLRFLLWEKVFLGVFIFFLDYVFEKFFKDIMFVGVGWV